MARADLKRMTEGAGKLPTTVIGHRVILRQQVQRKRSEMQGTLSCVTELPVEEHPG